MRPDGSRPRLTRAPSTPDTFQYCSSTPEKVNDKAGDRTALGSSPVTRCLTGSREMSDSGRTIGKVSRPTRCGVDMSGNALNSETGLQVPTADTMGCETGLSSPPRVCPNKDDRLHSDVGNRYVYRQATLGADSPI
ncbi:hypothetical protein ASPCAL14836 [Aspergillus calidoustus]|uniref:Uncharacterized protein n=1 Tax=Aspergillus calidoustus TaxID=454130 RepID=A0A0U5GI50_ASPCI|nr:hypothetical protein ASPCAL14836 [Aspergillus calidoustus]